MIDNAYNEQLTKLAESKKYSTICPETLSRILTESFERYDKPKDASKAAREKLHAISGAFMTTNELSAAKKALSQWRMGDDEMLETALSKHSSTRERLPLDNMDAIYSRIFEITGEPRDVLDLACGLNPAYLAARGITVTGLDINFSQAEILNSWAKANSLPLTVLIKDLLAEDFMPEEHFHIALIMKFLPVIEGQRNGSAKQLLEQLNAEYVVVTFPTRTLRGRSVGMERHYSEWFAEHMPECYTVISMFTTRNELIYILKEA